jgi:twinkle protein
MTRPKIGGIEVDFIEGEYQALSKRGISEDTCKRLGYQVGKVPDDFPSKKFAGKVVHIENYYDDAGMRCGQKCRNAAKDFMSLGDTTGKLFGRKSAPAGGKLLVITEGAIDSLSYAEVRKNWPVVSIPNGCNSAAGTLSANVKYLETFEKVVLCFDNDEPGQLALAECRGILSPGKMYEAHLDAAYKDLNEALLAGDVKAILAAAFNAEMFKPQGIVSVTDIFEEAIQPIVMGLPWFIPQLTALTYGRRRRELYGLGAGTGVGKTDVFTEQVNYDVNTLNLKVGLMFLEQKPTETLKRVAGKYASKRFHVPAAGWTVEELRSSITALTDKIMLYDSFGSTEWSDVKSAIRFMNKAQGIYIFYLDHLTAMADSNDERGSLEQIMKEMAGLADELDIIIHYISHLATPEGRSHEEGGRVTIRHFKGARAIGFWSHFMFGLERDQQSEDEDERQTTTFRVLKDRYTGQATGHTIELGYNVDTGRIILPGLLGKQPTTNAKDEKF